MARRWHRLRAHTVAQLHFLIACKVGGDTSAMPAPSSLTGSMTYLVLLVNFDAGSMTYLVLLVRFDGDRKLR